MAIKVTEIIYHSEHRLANLCATTKLLRIPLKEAKDLVQCSPCRITFNSPKECNIKKEVTDLINELEKYDIKVQITI